MAIIEKQVRMVFDLNKCLGCHTCTMACKTQWTDGRIDIPLENLPDNPEGLLYQYWNNVETIPGRGYPRGVFTKRLGGGFVEPTNPDSWETDQSGEFPKISEDYGDAWEYNYDEVLKTEGGDATADMLVPSPAPDGPDAYSSNWDEDVGAGEYPNSYYFYLPRICNHCTDPACLASCPKNAIYKREEDGIVLIDQDRCDGYRACIKGCPYKKTYYNWAKKRTQKCIFCYPRLEIENENEAKGPPFAYDPLTNLQPPRENFCFNQCVGRIRYVGYDTNPDAAVNRLVDYWGVALQLHPEFGTDPNLYYIPPLSPPKFRADGRVRKNSRRIPINLLAKMFGDDASQTLAQRKARINEIFAILEEQRAITANGGSSELIDILTAHSEADRLQLHLG
jgi:nitrate reductase beta subunit